WVLLSEDQIYVKEVDHTYVLTPKMHKEGTIYKLIEYENPASSMIFCNTKEEVRQVYTFLLGKGLPAAMLSSDLPQKKREKVMASFRSREIRHLVTTDVASRGIDIEDLAHEHRERIVATLLRGHFQPPPAEEIEELPPPAYPREGGFRRRHRRR